MHRPRHRMGGVRMAGAGPDPPRGFAGFERMTKCGGEEKKNKKVPLAEHKDVTGKDRSSSGAPCRISATLSVRELWEKKRKKRKREKKEKRAAHIFSSRRLLFVLANFFETNPLSCFAHYSHFDKITTLETVWAHSAHSLTHTHADTHAHTRFQAKVGQDLLLIIRSWLGTSVPWPAGAHGKWSSRYIRRVLAWNKPNYDSR